MEISKFIQKDYIESLKSRKSKHKFYWQSQAEEVSNHFGKPLYWLFRKFPSEEIMSEYKYQAEKGNKDANLFIRILKSKTNMTREGMLEKMREDYRTKNVSSLKRHFSMGQWILTEDDKVKIQKAIDKLDMVSETLRIIGGKVVS